MKLLLEEEATFREHRNIGLSASTVEFLKKITVKRYSLLTSLEVGLGQRLQHCRHIRSYKTAVIPKHASALMNRENMYHIITAEVTQSGLRQHAKHYAGNNHCL